MELASFGIHVSELSPRFVRTRISLSCRMRSTDYNDSDQELVVSDDDLDPEAMATRSSNEVENGIDHDLLAARVITGERNLYSYASIDQRRYPRTLCINRSMF